jgi:hypothetical protein
MPCSGHRLRSGKHTACATRTQAAGALGPHSFQPFSGEKQMAKTMNILSDKGSIHEKLRKHANYVITSASVGPAKGSSGDVAHDLLSGKPPTAYLTRPRRHQLCWPSAVGDPRRRFPPGETTCEPAHRLMQVEARVAGHRMGECSAAGIHATRPRELKRRGEKIHGGGIDRRWCRARRS